MARHDNSELFGSLGDNFWRSVWKRIESSDPRSERSAQVRGVVLEAPRDYVVETDNQIHASPS